MEAINQLAPFTVVSQYRKMPVGTLTPVGIYLRLRDRFANSTLFENADAPGKQVGCSYICFDAVARFELDGNRVKILYPDGVTRETSVSQKASLADQLDRFRTCFYFGKQRFPFQTSGLFTQTAASKNALPGLVYQAFRCVLVVPHHSSELYLIEHTYRPSVPTGSTQTLEMMERLLKTPSAPAYAVRTRTAVERTFGQQEGWRSKPGALTSLHGH